MTRPDLSSIGMDLPDANNTLLGIYIWRINQTAEIWFNGSKISADGNTNDPMNRHWNSPMYFAIPAALIESNNEILIKHTAQHGWGSMEPVIIGNEDSLKPLYDFRNFIQHDVSLGLLVFVLCTGMFCFTVWFYRRQDTQYLWFAAASIGLSIFCLNQFILNPPIGPEAWRWLNNIATDSWAACMLVFMLRSLKLERPMVEKLVTAYVLTGIPLYFYASYFQVFDINIYYHAGALAIAIYSFYTSLLHYIHTRVMQAAFYCLVIALIFIAGVHDSVMQATGNNGLQGVFAANFQDHFNSLHFAAPIMFLAIAVSLIRRFIDSMNEADTLNRVLEARVDAARQELAENYKAIEEVLIYQTASEERERIYRDLHDDVGSKLLSLYYRLEKQSDSALAKSALEDLRDIVSRKSLDSSPLVTAVKQWHTEAMNRVRDAEIPLTWDFDSDQSDIVLSELQHTHLRRMLREVLSNAILHGDPVTEIKVDIVARDGELKVAVANDGAPKPVQQWQTGRGISNLRIRARDLRGDLAIRDMEGSWVQVAWHVPIVGQESI